MRGTVIDRLRRWTHGPAVLGYSLLTVVVMWPAVRHFRTRPMVDGVDAAMFEWLWWTMPRAAAEGSNPLTTDLIFHPVGADLALTTSAPIVALVTWPMQAALGPAAQINLVQFASMFLAGLATYLLAHRVCRHRGAAFVAGVAYALLPHRFAHVDSHLNLVETAALPFGVLAFLAFVDAPTLRRAVVLGVTVGVTFLIEPQLAVLLGFCLVPLAVVHRRAVRAELRHLVLGAAVATLVAAPLLVPMAVALATGGAADPDPTRASLVYSASPLSWVVPPLDRLWLGNLATLDPLTFTTEGIAYPGLVLLGLAFAGVSVVDRAERRGWVAMALVGVVLSLGPYLYVRNTSLSVPLPYFGLRAIPGFDTMRVPGRFALVGALGIHVLGASTLAAVARRVPARAAALVVGAAALTVVELLPRSLPERPYRVAEAYEAIADHDGTGAVLEIPLKWSTTQGYFGYETTPRRDFMFLVAATVHGRPVASGAVSRYPDDQLDELTAIPVYRQLLALTGEPGFDDPLTFGHDDLEELGIGYVVYHHADPVPAALSHFQGLGLPVLVDDGEVIIWTVDAGAS